MQQRLAAVLSKQINKCAPLLNCADLNISFETDVFQALLIKVVDTECEALKQELFTARKRMF